jgi:hypothetical protein
MVTFMPKRPVMTDRGIITVAIEVMACITSLVPEA